MMRVLSFYKFSILVISIMLLLSYNSFGEEIIIDNFDDYSVGSLIGQGGWTSQSGNGPIVQENQNYGNVITSSDNWNDSAYAQLNYPFRFNKTMNNCYIQFTGQITDGSGNNCNALLYIYDNNTGSETGSFGFGLYHNPSQGKDHQPFINPPKKWGSILSAGIWYDFRLEIDWSKTTSNGVGLACLKYKRSTNTEWITESGLSNIELNINGPENLNAMFTRNEGLSGRVGKLDNILINYGDENINNSSIWGKIITSSEILGYTANVGGATIKAIPFNLSTVTDIYGEFEFADVPTGECIIQIESSYFQTLTKSIQVNNGKNIINSIEIFKPKCQNMFTQQEVDLLIHQMQSEKDTIITEKEATIAQLNTSIASMYTQGYLDEAINEAEKRGELKYDINNDGKVGLEEVIKYLETISGVRVESLIIFPEKRKYFMSD